MSLLRCVLADRWSARAAQVLCLLLMLFQGLVAGSVAVAEAAEATGSRAPVILCSGLPYDGAAGGSETTGGDAGFIHCPLCRIVDAVPLPEGHDPVDLGPAHRPLLADFRLKLRDEDRIPGPVDPALVPDRTGPPRVCL